MPTPVEREALDLIVRGVEFRSVYARHEQVLPDARSKILLGTHPQE
jgi:hypothetical protein